MVKIDLHMHSNISSDGEFIPDKLVALCAEAGVALLSLTDHNSTRGVDVARRAAKMYGIRFISGVELNCQTTNGTVLHVLGYGVDDRNPIFDLLEKEVNDREARANIERIPILRELGIQIDELVLKEIQGDKILICEMLAETALVNPNNRDHPLLQPFFPGGSRSDRPFVNFFGTYVLSAERQTYRSFIARLRKLLRSLRKMEEFQFWRILEYQLARARSSWTKLLATEWSGWRFIAATMTQI